MTIAPHADWPRWILSTFADSFDNQFSDTDYQKHYEGSKRPKPDGDRTLLEFRMNGPNTRQVSRGYFILDFSINIWIRDPMDLEVNWIRIRKVQGAVQEWLGTDFCILRSGGEVGDDDSFVGTAQLLNREDTDEQVLRTANFGQIDVSTPLHESTVEANYRMTLRKGA